MFVIDYFFALDHRFIQFLGLLYRKWDITEHIDISVSEKKRSETEKAINTRRNNEEYLEADVSYKIKIKLHRKPNKMGKVKWNHERK